MPIVDFYLLDGYFSSGALSQGYYQTKKSIETLITSTDNYYSNEDEMNTNIIDYIKSPLPINKLKDGFRIVKGKITPEDFPFQVYFEHCKAISL